MSSHINLEQLSKKIAYITINPQGNFLKSAQLGFQNAGLFPQHLIYVKPTDRLWKEFRKHKLSFFSKFLFPQLKRFWGNKKSFSNEVVEIKIPNHYSTPALNCDETVRIIQTRGIKYLINCGAGIFRKRLIDIPGLYVLNAHAGRFPDYKNMNVVEWAIYHGEKVVGTVHQIDYGIDTGAVWLEEELDLNGCEGLVEAREMAFDKVIKLVAKAILLKEAGEITPKKYNAGEGKNWYRMHSYFQQRVEKSLKKNSR